MSIIQIKYLASAIKSNYLNFVILNFIAFLIEKKKLKCGLVKKFARAKIEKFVLILIRIRVRKWRHTWPLSHEDVFSLENVGKIEPVTGPFPYFYT